MPAMDYHAKDYLAMDFPDEILSSWHLLKREG